MCHSMHLAIFTLILSHSKDNQAYISAASLSLPNTFPLCVSSTSSPSTSHFHSQNKSQSTLTTLSRFSSLRALRHIKFSLTAWTIRPCISISTKYFVFLFFICSFNISIFYIFPQQEQSSIKHAHILSIPSISIHIRLWTFRPLSTLSIFSS